MRRLLIATTNPAKLAEYRILLAGFALELVSLADLKVDSAPAESGTTFAENAMLKAHYYFERSGLPTLADDGGLEVDALGGEPGVRSHRWLGGGVMSGDEALADEVIRRMKGVEPGRRTARIRAAAALVYREGAEVRERVAEAAIEGVIPEHRYPQMRRGFPYRAVLFIPERQCYLAELGEREEARISQRRMAVDKLRGDVQSIART